MKRRESAIFRGLFLSAITALFLVSLLACKTASAAGPIPNPAVDEPLAKARTQQTAVFSGGCFWGVQAVFEHVKGVTGVIAGYSGGAADTAHYEIVSTGDTGHAESVKVTYDPSQISYGRLLKVFFSVAHDPTQLNRQGPDEGTQYRSIVFYASPDQKRIVQAYIDQLNQAKFFSQRIVTEVTALNAFYPAEDYHQDYLVHHPNDPYIMFNDLPKLTHLQQEFPELYVAK